MNAFCKLFLSTYIIALTDVFTHPLYSESQGFSLEMVDELDHFLNGKFEGTFFANENQYDHEYFQSYTPAEASDEVSPYLWNKRIYLATYPRSGSHWIRYLIEEATHIATSSVYCDPDVRGDINGEVIIRSHLGKPLPWGGFCPKYGYEGKCKYPTPDDTVVVKTHFPAVPAQQFDRLPFMKVIRIVRHPVDSFYSFYVWSKKNNPVLSKIPIEFLEKKVKTWKKFHEYWNGQENIITIRYEDFLSDPHKMLKIILETMKSKADEEDIKRALERFPAKGVPLKHLHEFNAEDLAFIQMELGECMKQFNYTIP